MNAESKIKSGSVIEEEVEKKIKDIKKIPNKSEQPMGTASNHAAEELNVPKDWVVKQFAEQIDWMQSKYLDGQFEKKNCILWKLCEDDKRTVINNTVNDVNHDKTILQFSKEILSSGNGFIREILEYINHDIWKLGSKISCKGGTYNSLDKMEAEIKDGLLKDLVEKKKEAERVQRQQQQEKETKKRHRDAEESVEKERKKMKSSREAFLQKLEKKPSK